MHSLIIVNLNFSSVESDISNACFRCQNEYEDYMEDTDTFRRNMTCKLNGNSYDFTIKNITQKDR